MEIEGLFWSYEKDGNFNYWRIGRKDNKDCVFPTEKRAMELGQSILGNKEDGSPRLLAAHCDPNYIIIHVVPKTDPKRMKALFTAIGQETH